MNLASEDLEHEIFRRKHQEETYDSNRASCEFVSRSIYYFFFCRAGVGGGWAMCILNISHKCLFKEYNSDFQRRHTNEGLCTITKYLCISGRRQTKKAGQHVQRFKSFVSSRQLSSLLSCTFRTKTRGLQNNLFCIKKCIDKLYQGSPFSLVFVNAKDIPFALNKTGGREREKSPDRLPGIQHTKTLRATRVPLQNHITYLLQSFRSVGNVHFRSSPFPGSHLLEQ